MEKTELNGLKSSQNCIWEDKIFLILHQIYNFNHLRDFTVILREF